MIELYILESYKKMNKCYKKISNNLAKQLYSGIIKITKDYYSGKTSSINNMQNEIQYIIKISGVWENNEEIGITFKLMEAFY
jgi:hypothetical protein